MNKRKRLIQAQQLVDTIKYEYANSNIAKAWEYWKELFELYNTPSTASDEQRMADCVELHSFLQQITNEEVYAITDYGNRLFMAKESFIYERG